MCSGVCTAEMALAAATNIVNKSKSLSFRVDMRCMAVWEAYQHVSKVLKNSHQVFDQCLTPSVQSSPVHCWASSTPI